MISTVILLQVQPQDISHQLVAKQLLLVFKSLTLFSSILLIYSPSKPQEMTALKIKDSTNRPLSVIHLAVHAPLPVELAAFHAIHGNLHLFLIKIPVYLLVDQVSCWSIHA